MNLIIKSQKFGEKTIFIDDEDFKLVSKYRWYIKKDDNTFYARAFNSKRKGGDGKKMTMHRLLMGFPKFPKCVDHIDGNGLNNKRSNLRETTQAFNAANSCKPKNNKTGYKGVHFEKTRKKYRVRIGVNYKRIDGGFFDTAIEAAKKYNELAKLHFGEFARLNNICQ